VLNFKKTTVEEIALLHDFYFESSEPDSPKSNYDNLSSEEKSAVPSQFPVGNYLSAMKENELIGFVGFFPDDDLNVNIFYVLSPRYRGKGYFRELLNLSILHCRNVYSDFKYIRALTRLQNLASIRGLERFSFIRRGQITEEVQPDVPYEEYVYRIK
jgi:RimJ/RimL family protein N-acetyltransferase